MKSASKSSMDQFYSAADRRHTRDGAHTLGDMAATDRHGTRSRRRRVPLASRPSSSEGRRCAGSRRPKQDVPASLRLLEVVAQLSFCGLYQLSSARNMATAASSSAVARGRGWLAAQLGRNLPADFDADWMQVPRAALHLDTHISLWLWHSSPRAFRMALNKSLSRVRH